MNEQTRATQGGTGMAASGRSRIGLAFATLLVVAAWMPQGAAIGKPAIRRPPEKSAVTLPVANRDKGAGPAIIVAEKPIHDFGEKWIGPALDHTFLIKNDGKSTLEISSVRPSCGCTIAGKYPKKIAPGETGEFPFKIQSKKLRGKYEKSIKIYSNDPDTPELQLKLKGVCKRYVDVVPTNAYFGKITTDEPRENVLKITNNTEEPFEVSLSKAEDGKFKFELVETQKGKEYELHIKIDPPYAPGSLRGTTNLITSVEAQKEIRIGATARIPERLEVQPPSIVISPARVKDRGYSRPIRFTNYGSNPVKILSATADDEKIGLAVKERTEGKAYTINVEMPAGWVPPEGGRTITLKTDDPDKPTIEIKVTTVASRRSPKKPTTPRKRPAEQMVGKIAPGMSVKTVEGKSLTASDLAGKVTVLDFFAVNCGFCKKQIPILDKVRQEYEAKGVRFVNVVQKMRKDYTEEQILGVFTSYASACGCVRRAIDLDESDWSYDSYRGIWEQVGDDARMKRMSIIGEGKEKRIRMAHLAIVGSHSVNGVAALHTRLLKEKELKDFHKMYPDRINNKTNGITPRRWLRAANPELAKLVSDRNGNGWIKDLDKIRDVEKFADDPD
ncbi:MAG: glycogen/starch/alpha-glucan phosphorylase, partial [Planctomycetes bacterium]|nr:glycogen/starch/alpha-glucan phosphorylase [Planctomycetota bacterium]